MNDKDSSIAALLDEATADRLATRDGWDAILHDARRGDTRGRWLVAGVPAVAAIVAATLLLALAWPLHDGTRGGVLDRALAAVGEGPVLHVVFREGWGGTLVDLQSDRRTSMRGEKEAWYDPKQGLHEAMRFGGVLEYDVLYPANEVPASLVKTYAGLGTEYVAALRAGQAAVAGEGEVDGIPVLWIKIHRELLPDVADNRLHEFAQEIAISRETYKPVATRDA